jgi:hypothetical protein
VIRDWNGAVLDSTRGRIVFTGGGHTGYYGNELYALELDASPEIVRLNDPTLPTSYAHPSPTQHTLCSDPTIFAAIPIRADGTACDRARDACAPNSRHNYWGLAYLPTTDQLWIYGGYLACDSGTAVSDTWLFDFASGTWREVITETRPERGYARAFASDFVPTCGTAGCVILHDGNRLYHYDVATESYTVDVEDLALGAEIGGVWDPDRERFVMIGAGELIVADYGASPVRVERLIAASTPSLESCGDALAATAQGAAYDPVTRRIVLWPNEGGRVYELDVEARSCTVSDFGSGPRAAAVPNGTFGRFRYVAHLDGFVLIHDYDQDAYVLRLR